MIAEYFATGPSFLVASPEGRVMLVASEIGFHADEPQIEETYQGFLFLNADTWTVDTERLLYLASAILSPSAPLAEGADGAVFGV